MVIFVPAFDNIMKSILKLKKGKVEVNKWRIFVLVLSTWSIDCKYLERVKEKESYNSILLQRWMKSDNRFNQPEDLINENAKLIYFNCCLSFFCV